MPDGCRFMAVVKANAYGHGDILIARLLNSMGVTDFAVATLEEGIALRKNNIKGMILILGYTAPAFVPLLNRYDLTQTVADAAHGIALKEYSDGRPVRVHLKIDTGMHRLGLSSENIKDVKTLLSTKGLLVTGMFTHLCCCDSLKKEDRQFTAMQINRFFGLTDTLKKEAIPIPPVHIQSSYGLINAPALPCSYARIGIMMYGCLSEKYPSDVTAMPPLTAIPDLLPVLSLYSYVVCIHKIPKGDTIGYGRAYRAEKEMTIAVIPVGYGDGYPRNISGKGQVLIKGRRAPIIGRICMDQMMVDISHIPGVRENDPVTLIGQEDKERILAEDLAWWSGTITNEILCRLSSRIHRIEAP